jgi:hypothetical protein
MQKLRPLHLSHPQPRSLGDLLQGDPCALEGSVPILQNPQNPFPTNSELVAMLRIMGANIRYAAIFQ